VSGRGKTPAPAIRPIAARDVDALFRMIAALAEHEKLRDELTVTIETLRKSGFGEAPKWRGFIAETAGHPCGYATYTEDFHLWSGAPRICLDDVYVSPEMRGSGLGERLMRAVFDVAGEAGAYVSWTVRPENKRAIAFYERLGAKVWLTGKCGWRAPPK
jgi:ribosomal protein S18 acetylase RimI-like enzyme